MTCDALRSGCVRPGDRLLAVDGTSLLGASLRNAHDALKRDANSSALVRLSLEVDVAPRMTLGSRGPLLLEVERAGGDPALGLALAAAPAGGVIVAAVRPGSVVIR